jgi:hypothetical protein
MKRRKKKNVFSIIYGERKQERKKERKKETFQVLKRNNKDGFMVLETNPKTKETNPPPTSFC